MATDQDSNQSRGFPTSRYIHLNVGGVNYMTSQETLTRYPDSMLGHMFTQERIPLAKDEQGRFLIDRDGPSFRHILNFLREDILCLPENCSEHAQLLREARFYQLEELVRRMCIHLNVNGVHYSTTRAILTKDRESLLAQLFTEECVPLTRDDEGRYILESGYDGHLLRYILNFLEDGDLHLPEKFDKFGELEREISYYRLSAGQKALEIPLNVGGQRYTTTRVILTKEKGSLLEEIFTQTPIPLERDSIGRYIIQRDGGIFKYILNYLSTGDPKLPLDTLFYKDLEAEVEFYRMRLAIPKINLSSGRYYNPAGEDFGYEHHYSASWKTLTKYKGSTLEERFIEARVQDTKYVYGLPGDGGIFRHVLKFLETGNIENVPQQEYPKLLGAARRYRLAELQRLLT